MVRASPVAGGGPHCISPRIVNLVLLGALGESDRSEPPQHGFH